MTNNPDKDSFVTVAKRSSKNVRPASGILPPNTRARAKSTTGQPKSSIPTQIETSNGNDDSSRISNKSSSSKWEAHYKELLQKEQAKFDAKIKNMKDCEDKLTMDNQKLTEEVFDLHAELHERNDLKQSRTAKVVTENKNKNNKNNNNDFAILDDDNDDEDDVEILEKGDIDDENKSYPSVTPKNKPAPKSSTSKFSTPAANNLNPTSGQPSVSTPELPQGHTWTQFRDSTGDILWRAMPTHIPPGTGHSSSSAISSSSPVNLTQNCHQQNQFTAPPGCLQFHRPTWSKEIKDISCNSDDLSDIKTWYDDFRSCLLSATQGKQILPKLENLTSTYDFCTVLLPPSHLLEYSPFCDCIYKYYLFNI